MKGIVVDIEGNIVIEGGTMKIDTIDAQIAEHVICAFKGEYPENPHLGGELLKMQNGTPGPFWSSDIHKQLLDEHVNATIELARDGNFIVNVK
jgi:hypothetical protein